MNSSKRSCLKKWSTTRLDWAESKARMFYQAVYLCPHCGKYHLTKKAQDDSEDEKAREARAIELENVRIELESAAKNRKRQPHRRRWKR